MKRNLIEGVKYAAVIAICAVLAGCTLPVPKTSIAFKPDTKALNINSPKDVKIGRIEVLAEGTNFTLTVVDYESKNSLEVVKAAADAQAKQVQAAQDVMGAVIAAAAGGAK